MSADAPQTIQSSANADFQRWRRLARDHGRGDTLLLQGEHLCRAWLQAHGLPAVLVAAEGLRAAPGVQALWHACAGTRRVWLADALAARLSQVEHGPAVFFVAAAPVVELPARITQDSLWLDRVQDPGNLGTLLRTAAAAGIERAFLSVGCAAAWSPKALRSGQGAQFVLAVHERTDLLALTGRLAVPLAVTTLAADARDLYAQDLRAPCAWVFGNEGQGVAPELTAAARWRLRIPQAARVESLNVAAAAAVCLFEQRRQRLAHPAAQ